MKKDLLFRLRCPASGAALKLADAQLSSGEIESGLLVSPTGQKYPIVRFIPRFVGDGAYTQSFGYQWNLFRSTQLDTHSGLPISRDRFYAFSGWSPAALEGKTVLDVGCGAGRFTEIALEAGARVIALDYSDAVDACWTNHALHPRLDVVQADMHQPPLAPASFDFVYCFGVLQHTPDPRAAFHALPTLLKRGEGRLAIDVYPKLLLNVLWPKYWIRPLSRRLPPSQLFRVVEKVVPVLLPVSRAFARVPAIGRKLRHAIPVANYEGIYPLDSAQLEEWAVLDTFDMFAPVHDHPQSIDTVRAWFVEAGLRDVVVERNGFVVGRGRAP